MRTVSSTLRSPWMISRRSANSAADSERNPAPPQYYTAITLDVRVSGRNITPKKMERAIGLSQEKYCSVRHTLRDDIKIEIKYEII